ncbi:restriction endonuclease subunit S, partial [Zobellia amurskyensis]
GYPIGTVENMKKLHIDVSGCRTIGNEDFEYLKRNNCKPLVGDVLFSKDGTIGKTFVFNQKDDLVLLSSIAIIRTKKETLLPEFCSLMLESPVFITEIEKRKSGTALKRIVLKDIKKFRVNLPSIEIQREVSNYLISLNMSISILESKILSSKALQKSLINQVF